jgi:hypothetical protein
MSRKNPTAMGIGAAISGAAIAAFIGMGTAHADPSGSIDNPFVNTDTGGYSELFGGTGTVQGAIDAQDDVTLAAGSSSDAAAFSSNVVAFEDVVDHPLADIIQAIDPEAFVYQVSTGIDPTGSIDGAYLVPDDSLGYLATSLDYFLLSPTGLGDLLGPIGEILLGSSF